jgi:hypothetical protein
VTNDGAEVCEVETGWDGDVEECSLWEATRAWA